VLSVCRLPAEISSGGRSKARFKRLIIIHSCRLAANNRRRLNNMKSKLRVLQQQELQNHGQHAEEIIRLKTQIKTLVDEISEGAKVRSRAQYLDNEEKPSPYFIRKEKKPRLKINNQRIVCEW